MFDTLKDMSNNYCRSSLKYRLKQVWGRRQLCTLW